MAGGGIELRMGSEENEAVAAARRGNGSGAIVMPGDILSPVTAYQLMLVSYREPDLQLIFFLNECLLEANAKAVKEFLSKPELSISSISGTAKTTWKFLASETNCLRGQRSAFPQSPKRPTSWIFSCVLRRNQWGRGSARPFFTIERRKSRSAPSARREIQSTVICVDSRSRLWSACKKGQLVVTPTRAEEPPPVTAIICFRDRAEWTIRSLESLLRCAGNVALEILLVNNQSSPDQVAEVERAIQRLKAPARIIHYNAAFNFAEMHNLTISRKEPG